MKKFNTITSTLLPLDRANVDTDQIIPKQFLRSISRIGFGDFLFDEWRYLDQGQLGMNCNERPLNPDFILNDSRYQNSEILLTRDNFGCGSSREHAVWAIMEYGLSVIIAPSFGDIFSTNAYKNGLLPISLPALVIDELFVACAENSLVHAEINLVAQTVSTLNKTWSFEIDHDHRHRLLEGLDDIGETLCFSDAIKTYENKRRQLEPWLFHKND